MADRASSGQKGHPIVRLPHVLGEQAALDVGGSRGKEAISCKRCWTGMVGLRIASEASDSVVPENGKAKKEGTRHRTVKM